MTETTVAPEGQPLRVDVTLDEMEQGVKDAAAAQKAAADAAAAEEARKKAGEAADDPKVSALKEALRLSEESRTRLERSLAERPTQPVAAAPIEPTEKPLTKEELAELFGKDPVAAIEYMQTKSVKTVEDNLVKRLQPLVAGNASTLEEQMRQKYPDEFKVFGDQIRDFVSKADKATFANAQNWEDMISWMRGKNFDKMVAHRDEQARAKAAVDAHAAQAASAGTHVGSSIRSPAPTGGGSFDDTTKAIIKELAACGVLDQKDPEGDYRKWIGGR